MSSIAFSGAGVASAGYPQDSNLQTRMLHVIRAVSTGAETYTITHGSDAEKTREVIVLDDLTGLVYAATVTRTSATVTTVAVAGAGTYRIIIRI